MSGGVVVLDRFRSRAQSVTKIYLRCACGAESEPVIEVDIIECHWGQASAWATAERAGWSSTLEGRVQRPVCPACRKDKAA